MKEEVGLGTKIFTLIKNNRYWILLLLLLSTLFSFLLIYVGCLGILLTSILLFVIPYFLKERKPRRYFVYGFIVAIFTLLIGSIVLTQIFMTSPDQIVTGSSGNVTITDGKVVPRFGGPLDNYNFSMVYTNLDPVNSTDVDATLLLYDYVIDKETKYAMTTASTGPASSGWTYHIDLNLTEGIYWFSFNATTTTVSNVTYAETSNGFGPINAPWLSYYWVFLPFIGLMLVLPISLYFLIVGLFWWTEKAKQMRGGLPPVSEKKEKEGKEGKDEFECSNCGSLVSSYATRCPRCLAVFEEEVPKKRAMKVRKGARVEDKDKDENGPEQETKKD